MMRSIQVMGVFCLGLVSLISCHAKDLGVHGALFKISENNLLHIIEQRLQKLKNSGQLAEAHQKITKRVQERVLTPQPVVNVAHTTTPRQYLWDPTLVVEEEIKDHQGQIIVKKGTKINPLDHVSWGQPLLLIDGDAEDQVEFAQSIKAQKLVLVKGKPLALEQHLQRPVYFDQGGFIVQKFGIKQVPCRISQQGRQLLVEEIEITNKKKETKT